jgi:hypothetical protein
MADRGSVRNGCLLKSHIAKPLKSNHDFVK